MEEPSHDPIPELAEAARKSPDDPRCWNALGVALAERGRHEEALEALTESAKRDPWPGRALRNRGIVLHRLGRTTEAFATFDAVDVRDAEYAPTLYTVGTVLEELQRGDEAIARYENALRINPDYGEAYEALALALQRRGLLEQALALLKRASLRLPERSFDYAIGSVLFYGGHAKQALSPLRRAVNREPSRLDARVVLIHALQACQRPREALRVCREALKLAPLDAELHCHHAAVLVDLKRPRKAIAATRRAIRIAPEDAYANSLLASILVGAKRYRAASTASRRAIAIDPLDRSAHENLINAQLAIGATEFAAESLRAALNRWPNDASLHRRLGRILASVDLEESIRCCQRVVALEPEDVATQVQLGFMLVRAGRSGEAQVAFDDARTAEPSGVMAHLAVSFSAATCERSIERAIEILANARQVYPEDPRVLSMLGWFYCEFKLWPEATEVLEDCLRRAPQYPGVRVSLDQAGARVEREKRDHAALHVRAGRLLLLGRIEESIEALRTAIELGPGEASEYLELAELLQVTRRHDEQLSACDAAIRLDGDDLQIHVLRADALYKLERYEEARKVASACVEHYPTEPAGYEVLACCWLRLGEPGLARHACEVGGKLDGASGEIRLLHCQSLMAALDDTAAARELFSEALTRELHSYRILLETIELFDAAGCTREVTAGFEAMLNLPAVDWQDFYFRGVAFQRLKQYSEAVSAFEESLKTPSMGAGLALAECLWRDGNSGRTLSVLSEIATWDPGDPRPLDLQGDLHLHNQEYDQAATAFKQALSLAPDMATTHFNLAMSLSAVGSSEEALLEYRRSIALDPTAAAGYFELSRLLHRLGDYPKELTVLAEALSRWPSSKTALGAQVICFLRTGCSLEQLLPVIARLFDSHIIAWLNYPSGTDSLLPDWPHSASWLGRYPAVQEQLEVAVAAAKQQPDFQALQLYQVIALEETDADARALECLEALIAASPESAQAHMLLAQLQAKVSRPLEAAQALERAEQLASGQYPAVRQKLARLWREAGKYEAAESVLASLLHDYPTTDAFVEQATLYNAQGRYDEAGQACRGALELDSQDPNARFLLRNLVYRLRAGNLPVAQKELESLQDPFSRPTEDLSRTLLAIPGFMKSRSGPEWANPGWADPGYVRRVIQFYRNRLIPPEWAVNMQALKEEFATLAAKRVTWNEFRFNPEIAIRDLHAGQRAIERFIANVSRSDQVSVIDMVIALEQTSDTSLSDIAYVLTAIREESAAGYSFPYLTRLLEELRKLPEQALLIVRQWVEASPASAQRHLDLARVLQSQPERDQSQIESVLHEAVRVEPANIKALWELQEALVISNQYPEAMSVLTRIRTLQAARPGRRQTPTEASLLCSEAAVLGELDQLSASLERYEAARRLAPDEISAVIGCAQAYEALGHAARAKELYLSAAKLADASGEAQIELAHVFDRYDLHTQAFVAHARALRLLPIVELMGDRYQHLLRIMEIKGAAPLLRALLAADIVDVALDFGRCDTKMWLELEDSIARNELRTPGVTFIRDLVNDTMQSARQQDDQMAVSAYQLLLDTREALQWASTSPTDRNEWFRTFEGMSLEIAQRYANDANAQPWRLELAAEALEAGLAMQLGQAAALKQSDLTHLKQTGYRDVARRYLTALLYKDSLVSATNEEVSPERWVRLRNARVMLETALAAIRRVDPSFCRAVRWKGIAATAQIRPLVYLMAGRDRGLCILVDRDGGHFVAGMESLTQNVVREVLNSWRTMNLGEHTLDSGDDSDVALAKMWPIVMEPLVRELQERELSGAVLIPFGELAFLPLHLTWRLVGGRRQYAMADVGLTYSPSTRLLGSVQRLAFRHVSEDRILAILDDREDEDGSGFALGFPEEASKAERTLRRLYGERLVLLKGSEATSRNFRRHLRTVQIVYFLGHGRAAGEHGQATLMLPAGQPFQLEALRRITLGHRLWVVVACEAAKPAETQPEEAISVASALMHAGVAGVIAAGCVLDAFAAVPVSLRVMELVAGGEHPPAALRIAQQSQALEVTPSHSPLPMFGLQTPQRLGGTLGNISRWAFQYFGV